MPRRSIQSTPFAVVGLDAEEQATLRKILACARCPHAQNCRWEVRLEADAESVLAAVRKEPVAIVVCDRDRMADAWKYLLDQFSVLRQPPLLIVASRLADDRLWAEALNLGAYDVVAKPFDASEVARIAGLACAHWHEHHAARPAATGSVG